jgi:hypothetical protein
MNVTLVAYYGEKPAPIADLIVAVQNKLALILGKAFKKHDLDQVHGTLIGLEGTRVREQVLNANFFELQGLSLPIDFHQLFNILKDNSLLPLSVTVGGYKQEKDYAFTSRGQNPYLRSFSIQGEIAVAMGWPYSNSQSSDSIDRLRRSFNEANVLHKYHVDKHDVDNDFFFVLGRIDRSKVNQHALDEAQVLMRDFLMERGHLPIVIDREHLSVIAYVDTNLPKDTSRIYGLEEAEAKIDEIKSLYLKRKD